LAGVNTLVECLATLRKCEEAGDSPEIALMKLLIASEDASVVERALHDARASHYAARLTRTMLANANGCARVAAMLASSVDVPPKNGTAEEGIDFCRRLFDWSVSQSEEASVALYSLGSPRVLHDATREIEQLFVSWGILGPSKSALDIGCGIGRLETALASKLGRVVALDISEAMLAAARRRCADLPNVTFEACSGRHLPYPDASFDVVFAVDSFPYLVQSGEALVEAHFGEVRRVLRSTGEFIILEFSYRDDLALDRDDVASLAAAHGFDVRVGGAQPFTIWNGAAFRLQCRPSHASAER
jgi:SAM-dependent methyltransferase